MTQLSWKKPLALAVTLFVLGMFAYWLEFKKKPENEAKEAQAKKLFTLKDSQIESLLIANGTKVYLFKCTDIEAKLCKPGDNSKWEMVEPVKLRADDSNVRSFLSTLDNLTPAETIDLKDETPEKRTALLKDYGLDPAQLGALQTKRVAVKLRGDKPTELTLYMGGTHPIGDNVFSVRADGTSAKPDENKVYMVGSYFKTNVEKDLTYWRDKRLFSVNSSDVQSFTLKSAKGQIVATRKDGQWTLQGGKVKDEYTGDIENIDSFLSSVMFIAAKEFASENKGDKKAKAELRGAKPVGTLTFQTEKQGSFTLSVVKRAKPDRVFATLSTADPLYELEASAASRFEKELKDLRLNKLLTSMERFTAKKIEISGGSFGAAMVLVNANSKWQKEPSKEEVDSEKVSQFLEKLSGNRIKEFLSGAAYPVGEQEGIQITIGDEKNDKKRQYILWKKGDKLYAKDLLSQRKEAFGVDSTIKDALPWDSKFFEKAGSGTPATSPSPKVSPVKKG